MSLTDNTTEKSFTITKSYIIKLLSSYYKGDNSLTNPVKLFIDNESFDLEICRNVIDNLNNKDVVFFYMDLWLNDSVRYMIPGNAKGETRNLMLQILSDDTRGLNRKKMNNFLSNFSEANLNTDDFDWLKDWGLFDLDNADVRDIEKRLIQHKNYPVERKTIAYDLTQFEGFLPNDVQDIFLF